MNTIAAEWRRGSRVSPRRRRRPSAGHAANRAVARRAPNPHAAEDRRPFRIYMYDPKRALMISDGLNYIGERCARKEAAKITRYYGQPTEVRPSPRAQTPPLPGTSHGAPTARSGNRA